ncbi:MAG: sulfatase-like hydrolase/transferase [Hyphomonadaceae bacterium]|nr:sulfatase-like hydrolase/transferase [Hyphomonadaceae bacterium]
MQDSHPKRPNIVLVLFEDMSPRVGAFGDPIAHTPNFDRIAKEGVRYTNVFTTSGVCAPSRAALISGRYQHTIGAQHMRTMAPAGGTGGGPQGYHAVPPPHVKAFPELLRRAGYYTSNNSKTDYQFGQPFTIWDTSEPGADWSGRAPDQPFFHMVSLFNTHESAIWPVDLEQTPSNAAFYGLVSRNRQAFATREARTDPSDIIVPPYLPDTPRVRRDIATHYDNIAHTDAALGLLYDRLDREGLLDRTIIIVSSDHGDGLPRMKRSLYDSGLHVPLAIRYPDGRDAGSINQDLISFVDLAPTILSWADVKRPPDLAGYDFDGPDRDPVRDYVFAAQDRMDFDPNWRRAVRDRRYKLIQNFMPDDPFFVPLAFRDVQPTMQELWHGLERKTLPDAASKLFLPIPAFQLYDTINDPHEVDNLIDDPEHVETRKRLNAVLENWLARFPDMSRIAEADMIEAMWPGGEQPATAPPSISDRQLGGRRMILLASETEGASIGYRIDQSSNRWNIYTEPFVVPQGVTVQAKAIRYGYAESEISSLDLKQ